jgi:cytochrome c-type biogenesis protein CcsB
MHSLMLLAAALGYVAASIAFARSFSSARSPGASRAPLVVLTLAFALHTADLLFEIMNAGVLPVATFAGGFSFFAWLLVGLYLALQASMGLAVIGVLVSPLAFVAATLAVLVGGDDVAVPPALRSPWLTVHVTLAFLGNAVFALAFAVSAAFLLQQNLLKSRRGGAILHRLPAVQTLDRLSLVFLLWGFPLLTLGIVTGGFWSMSASGKFWTGEPREILAVLTWLLYAGLLQLRLLGGLHGRRAATWTIASFALLLASYLVVNLLQIGGRHGQGRADELTQGWAPAAGIATEAEAACATSVACTIPAAPAEQPSTLTEHAPSVAGRRGSAAEQPK